MKTYDYKGKKYIRHGECLQCGVCCTGWGNGPCHYLKMLSPSKSICTINDLPAEQWPNDVRCKSKAVKESFPDSPSLCITNKYFKNTCGYWFTEVDKVLIAAPTYDGKSYCQTLYLEAVEKIDWPDIETFWPNTTAFSDKANVRIAKGMEFIRSEIFLKGNCDRWLNLEVDIIPQPNILEVLLSYDRYKKIDWISHVYPPRGREDRTMSGFGCSIFSRRLMERYGFEDAPSDRTCDGWYWRKVQHDCTALELWGILKLRHLDG